ncbi:transcription factor HES-2 [Sceloporus undulatus]|uniref:transcription factor HES-2 n=1 Tax=Sceloporus undulatus TaxID=8520 RepID=UPI001C4D457B|nr:transcription factor HES-2 [Sceloporus undulatus]
MAPLSGAPLEARQEAARVRKSLKPLMEKRRRARINESLNQLKALILPLVGKDGSRYSKLEKADILEMTVQFLQDLPGPCASISDAANSYRKGYGACVSRLTLLLPKYNLLNPEACHRLLGHLQQACDQHHHCLRDSATPQDLSQTWGRGRAAGNPPTAVQRHSCPPSPTAQPPALWRPW